MKRKSCGGLLLVLAVACAPQDSQPADSAATSTVASVTTDAAATDAPPSELSTAALVVTEFGARMKRVSTTASAKVAAAAIRDTYAGLVDPALLERWAKNPSEAPGRAVSSPWPEKIEIDSSNETGGIAEVEGFVVEVTSTGVARRVPIAIRLRQTDRGWLITEVELTASPDETGDTAADAVAVVREYFRAIDAREFRKAYALWGEAGPPGQTFDDFEAGYADTQSVRVETGTPSRIEPAAGSRYVEIPVTIVATMRDASTAHFEGSYTLRRSVVEGGSSAWQLYRAKIVKAK